MTRGTELTAAVGVCLAEIAVANGYHTDIAQVYPGASGKPDKAPLPCILWRLNTDVLQERTGGTSKRVAAYQIEAYFSRTASDEEVQLCHHDILKAFGFDQAVPRKKLGPGVVQEEQATYQPAQEGSTYKGLVCEIAVQYVEKY